MAVRVSIEEFALTTRLSRRALRHYQDFGLLEPVQVDPATGDRSYDTSQVRTAQVIRHLRGLGMPESQVKAMLDAPDVQTRNEVFATHLSRMDSELDKVREAVTVLRGLLDPAPRPIQVEFRSVPSIRAAAITSTIRYEDFTAWWRRALDEIDSALTSAGIAAAGPPGGLYATELLTDEVGEATVFIPVGKPVRTVGRVHTTDLPPAELAVTVHDGPHNTLSRTYGALGTFVAERQLAVKGPMRENYLVTAANIDPDGQQRTEICWPIYRTSIF